MKKLTRLAPLWLLALPLAASAITIHINYDASVTELTNAAEVEAAFATAAQTFEDLYTNSADITITMYWGPGGPFTSGISLGRSHFELISTSYSEITNLLRANRTTVADTNSVASLPASDPTGGGPWYMAFAEARALNISIPFTNEDGEVGFATNVSYTFDPNNRIVAGKFDFIGVAEHELSEVLGRDTFGLNGNGFVPYDLFRFTNSGDRSFDRAATNAYFSVDNGVTALRYFYTNASKGDIQDWLSTANPDAYDAFAPSGHLLPITSVDITALDVLGYNGPGLAAPHLFATKTNGVVQIRFANTPGTSFTVLASTNLALPLSSWIVLGAPTENPPGLFQFTDSSPTNKLRFYDVRAP